MISNIVVPFHHTMAMKRCLESDEIDRQLKCKICGMGLCTFQVLQGVPYKGVIQLHDTGCDA